ncbi:MAG: magnesium transporter CorA family protein [Nanoarchaeota archaeon]|nr:magnesium transporter CorA family protein [Nanoarchaeota archaeon]
MLEILRITQEKLEVLEKPEPDCWINVSLPTDEELAEIKRIANVPEEVLSTLKDKDEIPIIEQFDSFTFMIIRAPYNNLSNDLEYFSVPVGIIITKDIVITLSYFDNDVVPKLKTQRFAFRKTQLTFRLLLTSARLFLNYLNEINKKMHVIETKLEQSQQNKVIMQMLEIQQSLVFFSTSLKSNDILLERIYQEKLMIKTAEDKRMLEKAIDENKQAIEMTYTYSNILSNTLDAFASIISNNLNIYMKVLAGITIIISIPTLIASFYGMNIPLPYQNSSHALAIVVGLCIAISAIVGFILWKKKFF